MDIQPPRPPAPPADPKAWHSIDAGSPRPRKSRRLSRQTQNNVYASDDFAPSGSDEDMPLVNKDRQRRIRNDLLTTVPPPGTEGRDAWELNCRESPLLRLPPELRNKIYELVLDVGQIKVCFRKYKNWKIRLGKCGQAGEKKYQPAQPAGFFCQILNRNQNPFSVSVREDQRLRRGMTLLSPVCRMLYKETAVLPFSLNAWCFGEMATMERYLLKENRLPRSHTRAIRILYTKEVLPDRFDRRLGGVEVMLVRGGLKMTKVVDANDPERRAKTWDISSWDHWVRD